VRGVGGRPVTSTPQGLTMPLRYRPIKLKLREVPERKQVGDAEGMINEGLSSSGKSGLFGGAGQV